MYMFSVFDVFSMDQDLQTQPQIENILLIKKQEFFIEVKTE